MTDPTAGPPGTSPADPGKEHPVVVPEAPGNLLALALLSLLVGAAAGLVGALFRLALQEADHGRDSLLAWAHGVGPAIGEQSGEQTGDVCFAGSGNALQNELPLEIEQTSRTPQPVRIEMRGAAEIRLRETLGVAVPIQQQQRIVAGNAGVQRRETVE